MLWARAVLRGDTRSARDSLARPELQGALSVERSARLASIGDHAVFLMEGRLTLWKSGPEARPGRRLVSAAAAGRLRTPGRWLG
ncbi:MAG: hypothetical protein FAZ92_00439 [Accumulibacter sp.]|nr:MAG: hypothetical protein FAZ92_00439 [Accumulibacter sp.]